MATTKPVPMGAPPRWRVTGQNPATRQAQGGRFVDGMAVHFITATGTAGTVFVPDAQYNPTTVRDLIDGKARQITDVGSLSAQG